MLPPDTTPTRTAPCPTCGQPALWAYEPLAEGDLCYCLCQTPTLAWVPTDPPTPSLRTAAQTAWAQTQAIHPRPTETDAAARRAALAVTFRQMLGRDLPETAIAADGYTATVEGLTFGLLHGDGLFLALLAPCPTCPVPLSAVIYSLAGLGGALAYLDQPHAPGSPFTPDPPEAWYGRASTAAVCAADGLGSR